MPENQEKVCLKLLLRAGLIVLFYQYSLALHLVEMDTDPDPETMPIRLDPDPQQCLKTSFTAVTR
jgi:hypothetical protein